MCTWTSTRCDSSFESIRWYKTARRSGVICICGEHSEKRNSNFFLYTCPTEFFNIFKARKSTVCTANWPEISMNWKKITFSSYKTNGFWTNEQNWFAEFKYVMLLVVNHVNEKSEPSYWSHCSYWKFCIRNISGSRKEEPRPNFWVGLNCLYYPIYSSIRWNIAEKLPKLKNLTQF